MQGQIKEWGVDIGTLTSNESYSLTSLEERLLNWSGERFVSPSCEEEDLQSLLQSGLLYNTNDIKCILMLGEMNQCHSNAAACWNVNQELCVIATGYALFDDGFWRQHSWLMRLNNEQEAQIIETTVIAQEYYGILLTKEEAEMFVLNNA